MFVYQSRILNKFYQINSVANQVVLEVGGSEPLSIPRDLEQNGANEIVTVSINKSFKSRQVTSKISALHADASNLDFDDCYFDSVISVATLEHISNLENVLKELYRVTKSGGTVYMQGAPLWSSRVGSHYIFSIDNVRYHYSENRILDNWEHLYSDKDKIRDRLQEHYSDKIIDRLLYEVYDSTFINRMMPLEIIKIVKESQFNVINIELIKWNETISNEMINQDHDELIIHLQK